MSHICIIEDDAAIAEIERDYLEINGFTVSIATDGVSGLNLTQKESFDLILLDLMHFGAEKIMGLFTSQEDAQVVALGRSYLHLVSWMYILPAITNGIQGFFRGMGDLKVTLYSTFMNMAGRVLAVIVMFLVFHFGFVSLAWANLIGWIVMLLFEIPLLMRQLKELRK